MPNHCGNTSTGSCLRQPDRHEPDKHPINVQGFCDFVPVCMLTGVLRDILRVLFDVGVFHKMAPLHEVSHDQPRRS